MEKLRVQLDEEIDHAVDLVCTAEVDYMVMGMSAETFWGGMEGNEQFKARVSRSARRARASRPAPRRASRRCTCSA